MSTQSALPRGTRLHNGAYAIGPVLGQGGFGITYKGGDLALKRYVAIKEYFPPGALRQNSDVVMADADKLRVGVADFTGEARVLSRFNHPGIVGVIGTFEENNTAYMVMEFVEGETLEARIAAKGALDEWETLDIGSRLAGALEIVHGAGVMHRDIKPENIVLKRGGGAVLIDFGTAREFEGTKKMTQIVTPGYAPLEQYAANAARGPASDIYALAATLYHALSGTKPVAATDRAADIALPPLQALAPNLTPMLAAAIMGALEMEAARRPQSAREFEAQLKGQSPPARRPPPPPPSGARPPIAPAPPTSAPVAGVRPPIPPAASQGIGPSAPPSVAPVEAEAADYFSGLGAALRDTTFERHAAPALALAFAPDGERLMSAGADGKICEWLWRDKINPNGAAWSAHAGGVLALSYSPDGAFLASGGRDERINIWDGTNLSDANRRPLATLSDCDGVIRDLAFCPQRRQLVVADAGAVALWDADTGGMVTRRTLGAVAVEWAPDGSALAVGGVLDGALQLWDGADLSERGRVAAHEGALTDIAWSPDGSLIATTGSDGCVRVWHAAQGALAWQHNIGGVPECAAWSPNSRMLAVGKGNLLFLWLANGQAFRRHALQKTTLNPNRGRIEKVAFAPVSQAPYEYCVALVNRDYSVDLCRIRLATME